MEFPLWVGGFGTHFHLFTKKVLKRLLLVVTVKKFPSFRRGWGVSGKMNFSLKALVQKEISESKSCECFNQIIYNSRLLNFDFGREALIKSYVRCSFEQRLRDPPLLTEVLYTFSN